MKEKKKKPLSEVFHEELVDLVAKIVQEQELDVTKNNVKEIVDAIMPQLDIIIARKVKEHLSSIAEFALKLFHDEETLITKE